TASYEKDNLLLGFNVWRSHQIVDVRTCPVLLPEIVALAQKLRAALPRWLPHGKSCDVQITALPEGFDVVLIGGPALGLEQREQLARLAEELKIAQLSWRKWDRSPLEPVAHRQPLAKTFGAWRVPFPPGSFLQATAAGEEALISFARAIADGKNRVLDLFCGLGGFGLSLPNAKRVTLTDIDGPAIQSLAKAVKGQPRFQVAERNLVSDPFSRFECNDFDAVIFDPPRGGAKAQVAQLAQSTARDIVAVSCDPPSFLRDAKILVEGGYELRALQPVDQFLWSTHLELAAHFAR
ncbi:MAG: class I SAM-dependent RNA methyltransferase, partial [Alphaproteobacteria bacterium]|nr:class I SAM-dependent RNA methyltransferase [Alphaproteobacteria bacterium]